jgi:hypothetical protein
LAPTFGLLFLPFRFKRFLLSIFFFSSRRKKKKKHKKKNAEKGESLIFFSRFYIWDETLLLLSLVHLPQALCLMSPQSFVLLKLGSSPELWRWNEQEMR